jgi:signal transduction histidine kinase
MLRRVHGIEVELHAEKGSEPDPSDVEVLRIAHEALHNAVRHAAARRVTVQLDGGEQRLRLEVSDDGIGFDPTDPELRSRHLGLTSMEERARELGGKLELRSAPGSGTTVTLEVRRNGR